MYKGVSIFGSLMGSLADIIIAIVLLHQCTKFIYTYFKKNFGKWPYIISAIASLYMVMLFLIAFNGKELLLIDENMACVLVRIAICMIWIIIILYNKKIIKPNK